MSQSAPVLLWFRQDLRLDDHAALLAAAATDRPVLPVFVLEDVGDWRWGGASRWWLHRSLAALDADLRRLGVPLVLRRGDPRRVLPELAADKLRGVLDGIEDRLRDAAAGVMVPPCEPVPMARSTRALHPTGEPRRCGSARPARPFGWRARRARRALGSPASPGPSSSRVRPRCFSSRRGSRRTRPGWARTRSSGWRLAGSTR